MCTEKTLTNPDYLSFLSARNGQQMGNVDIPCLPYRLYDWLYMWFLCIHLASLRQ